MGAGAGNQQLSSMSSCLSANPTEGLTWVLWRVAVETRGSSLDGLEELQSPVEESSIGYCRPVWANLFVKYAKS